jgi:hypothetical protein
MSQQFVTERSEEKETANQFLHWIGLRPTSGARTYHFDVSDSLQVTPLLADMTVLRGIA